MPVEPVVQTPSLRSERHGLGLVASAFLFFIFGSCACLMFLYWRYGPLLQRHTMHQQQLHRQLQLQRQQRNLLRHLRLQLQQMKDDAPPPGPDGAFLGKLNCDGLPDFPQSHDPMASQWPQHASWHPDPYHEDPGTVLDDLSKMLSHLQAIENVTSTTTFTTSTATTTHTTSHTRTTFTSTHTGTVTTGTSTRTSSTDTKSSTSTGTHTTTRSSTTGTTTTTTHTTTMTTTITTRTTTEAWTPTSKYAYVMMAHDDPGSFEHLWGALAVVRMLQRLSRYPIVLLTNRTHLPDGKNLASALQGLNVHILPVRRVAMPKHYSVPQHTRWEVAFWKLQIWTLTQFTKLIWLDSDSLISRSLDWLFHRPGMWAQRDDWHCLLKQSNVCSGILLLYPNLDDYQGLLDYANELTELPNGDQQLIAQYFTIKRHKAFNLLSDVDAAFGQCLGKTPTPYLNHDKSPVWGFWSVPAFVHKSGGWQNANIPAYSNVCFSINMTRQRYLQGNAIINICHYHPLGAYWRNHFCEAAWQLHISLPEVADFCTDSCWYLGKSIKAAGSGGADVCSPLSTTINYQTYNARTLGWPIPEVPSKVR